MITVTKMNGESIVLNAELIETVEARPDTLITLTTGNKIMVKEEVSEIVEKAKEYRRSVNLINLEKFSKINEENE
jgi:flagellar protein FlbD